MAEHTEVIVIGGGQAGLAAGYYLAQARIPFLILDAEARTGDSWRRRWDSLQLFTAARYSALPGLRFPGDPEHFPGKDAVADYLQNYARTLELPIRHHSRVTSLERTDGGYRAVTGPGEYQAAQVIISAGAYQQPRIPPLSEKLGSAVTQLHSAGYRNPPSSLPATCSSSERPTPAPRSPRTSRPPTACTCPRARGSRACRAGCSATVCTSTATISA